jgi:hypothetical protein
MVDEFRNAKKKRVLVGFGVWFGFELRFASGQWAVVSAQFPHRETADSMNRAGLSCGSFRFFANLTECRPHHVPG